jgi:iron complex outermembrane receptor protein
VAIPLSVVGGREIERLGLVSPSQIPQIATGVQLAQPNGTGSYSFAVRGVTQNDFADHEESPAAIYVDGAYVSQMSGLAFQLFDLDRVEVLRGPQGTLFGRNATSGLAQFISRAPTKDFSGYLSVSYGSYNDVKTEGAVSGPLVGAATRCSRVCRLRPTTTIRCSRTQPGIRIRKTAIRRPFAASCSSTCPTTRPSSL